MKIIIIGAGTTAKGIANILYENKEHNIIGFLGSNEEVKKNKGKKIFNSFELIGDRSLLKDLKKEDNFGFVVAIGDPKIRESVYSEAIASNLIPIKVISKNSIISQSAIISDGVIIKNGVIIGHNVLIGENTLIESGTIVEINSNIGPNCTIESSVLLNGENIGKKNVHIKFRTAINSYINIGKNQNIKENSYIDKNLPDILIKDY